MQTHKYPQPCDFIVHHIYTSMLIDFGVSSLYFGRVTIVLSLYLPRGQVTSGLSVQTRRKERAKPGRIAPWGPERVAMDPIVQIDA